MFVVLKDYFGRTVFAATLLIGIPALTVLWFAGGAACTTALTWQIAGEFGEGSALPRPIPLNLHEALLWTILSFGIFLGVRSVFLALRLRWNLFLSQIMAALGAFLLIRLMYRTLGVFNTPLSVWSVIMFVAFLSVFDSLEPERGDRWRAFFRALFIPVFGRSRWRR
jgi:hypothetical protein